MTTQRFAAIVLAALALASCGPPKATPGLTGATRENFVKGAVDSCARTAAVSNPTAPSAQITGYCTCAANKMADLVSEAELASIGNDRAKASVVMRPHAEAAARACGATGNPG